MLPTTSLASAEVAGKLIAKDFSWNSNDMCAQHQGSTACDGLQGNIAPWAADKVCNNSIAVLTMFANSRFIAKQTNSSTSLTTTTAITVEQKGPLASVSLRTAICDQATLLKPIALQGCLAHAVLKQ
jgi:hypothetical protein